ncbi:MAG: glycine dehydrogenase (aminomethyl-transferring), partial [Cyanobacteria bacterium P01_C01_bin.118]
MSYEQSQPLSATLTGSWAKDLATPNDFPQRHIGLTATDIDHMLSVMGYDTLADLISTAVPAEIRLSQSLSMGQGMGEHDALQSIRAIADQNQVLTSYIGLGYHSCITPPVIQRNILENPGWYTQYTPYQPEISQGRLEALLNYQTMVSDLTGLEIANASLLDEGTAAAEAMTMSLGVCKNKDAKKAKTFWVSADCHPQTIEVIRTRALPLGITVVVGDQPDFSQPLFGMLLQYPASTGAIKDYTEVIAAAHE